MLKKVTSAILITLIIIPLSAFDLNDLNDQLVDVVEKTKPSIVTITAEKVTKYKNPFSDFSFEGFPDGFFNFQLPDNGEIRSEILGSGVIVDENIILTNNHVVDNVEEIKVKLPDNREFEAEIIGQDKNSDIAVIKINAKNLQIAKLGNSEEARVGEIVLAIGNPFSRSLNNTITMGIISGLGRSRIGITKYENFIQTDAAINPGNSGGALVNLKGEVIGINSAILSRSGGSQGVGFSIPINLAKRVMNDIIDNGRVIRAWIGVSIQPVTQDIANSVGLKKITGSLVSEVLEDSPAEKAGLKTGDIILKVNNKEITNTSKLQLNISSRKPGDIIKLSVFRNDKIKLISIKLEEMPAEENLITSASNFNNDLGFVVENGSKELGTRFHLKNYNGVIVTKVKKNSKAARKGIRPGDKILSIGNKNISDINDFKNALKKEEGKSATLILIEDRKGGKHFVALKLK
ncbi:MAG: Do family serine endopeptidase [Candidatus Marinimicrobia bacterium]|nr:Do family serine endopeptidase [Candidatus Neomarinimicrobiota bacterium]